MVSLLGTAPSNLKTIKMAKIPTQKDFLKRIRAFEKHESRHPIYEISNNLIEDSWNNIKKVTDGLIVLLLVWNQAFYRYGYFDFEKLESWVKRWKKELNILRKRKIKSFSIERDEEIVTKLFNSLLEVVKIKVKNKKEFKSPVSVSKALHLLAPNFFPLWDDKISQKYGCRWYKSEQAYKKYFDFLEEMQFMANGIKNYKLPKNRPLLKLIDEYNYAKYTKNWL